MTPKIYHNPRCSKSRETLKLLEENKIEAEIIRYLDAPPSAAEMREILKLLGMSPRELMRRKEKLYKELNLGDENLSDDELITAMLANPRLIERPIVITDKGAAIGRPPENVLKLL